MGRLLGSAIATVSVSCTRNIGMTLSRSHSSWPISVRRAGSMRPCAGCNRARRVTGELHERCVRDHAAIDQQLPEHLAGSLLVGSALSSSSWVSIPSPRRTSPTRSRLGCLRKAPHRAADILKVLEQPIEVGQDKDLSDGLRGRADTQGLARFAHLLAEIVEGFEGLAVNVGDRAGIDHESAEAERIVDWVRLRNRSASSPTSGPRA